MKDELTDIIQSLGRDALREKVLGLIGNLQRQVGELQRTAEIRGRMVTRLQGEKRVLCDEIMILRGKLADAKYDGDPKMIEPAVVELKRWYGVVVSMQSALDNVLGMFKATNDVAVLTDDDIDIILPHTDDGRCVAIPSATPFANDPVVVSSEKKQSISHGKKPCSVSWCNKPLLANGLCGAHDLRKKNYGDALLVKRYVNKKWVLCREVSEGVYEPLPVKD